MAVAVTVGVGSEPPVARVPGSRRRSVCTVTFDTSYPTGGYAITAAQVGLSVLDTILCPALDQSATWFLVWNQSTGKLQLFEIGPSEGAATEEENGADVHTGSVIVEALGD